LRTGGEILFGQAAPGKFCEWFVAAGAENRTNYFDLFFGGAVLTADGRG
jgi:hypothetical protein